MRVLIVDQDSVLLETIVRALREQYSIDAVTNKGDCLDLLRQNAFDVVVAGERLVDGSGLELLGQVARRWPATRRVFAAERDRLGLLQGRLAPFDLFQTLIYPIEPERLLAALDRARDAQRAPPPPVVSSSAAASRREASPPRDEGRPTRGAAAQTRGQRSANRSSARAHSRTTHSKGGAKSNGRRADTAVAVSQPAATGTRTTTDPRATGKGKTRRTPVQFPPQPIHGEKEGSRSRGSAAPSPQTGARSGVHSVGGGALLDSFADRLAEASDIAREAFAGPISDERRVRRVVACAAVAAIVIGAVMFTVHQAGSKSRRASGKVDTSATNTPVRGETGSGSASAAPPAAQPATHSSLPGADRQPPAGRGHPPSLKLAKEERPPPAHEAAGSAPAAEATALPALAGTAAFGAPSAAPSSDPRVVGPNVPSGIRSDDALSGGSVSTSRTDSTVGVDVGAKANSPADRASASTTQQPSGGGSSLDSPAPVIREARLIRRVAATYPSDAQRAGLSGSVDLDVAISPEGTVTAATVTRADPPGIFEKSALAAARRFRYDPQYVDGLPAEAHASVHFDFAPSSATRP